MEAYQAVTTITITAYPRRILSMQSGLAMIKRILMWLIYGGSLALAPLEKRILDATEKHIGVADGGRFRTQVDNIHLLQRDHNNKIVRIYINQSIAGQCLSDQAESVCLAEVVFKHCDRLCTCYVMLHRGFLSSLEFRYSPANYRSGSTTIERVSIFPQSYPNIPKSIDRSEHGSCGST